MPKKPAKPKTAKSANAKPGPKPKMFKLEGVTWERAMDKVLTKNKPAGGWAK